MHLDCLRSYTGLSHTDWQFVPTVLNDLSDLCLSFLLKVYFATTVDFSNNLFNLFLDRKAVVIQTFIVRWIFVDSLDNRFGKRYPPSAPSAQTLANSTGTSIEAQSSFKAAISASVSDTNSLIATTAGIPNLRIFSTWRFKLAKPARTAPHFPLSEHL